VNAKAQLLAEVRDGGCAALAQLRALPPSEFATVRYDNGWTARDILAHVAAIEAIYPLYIKLAELGVAGESPPEGIRRATAEEVPDAPTVFAAGGLDALNERFVAARVDATVDELIGEFEHNRAATIAAIEAADEALLRVPVRSAGGIYGTLAAVVHRIAGEHIEEHVRDITGG